MNILAFAAKRALADMVDTLLASDTVQVSYAAPGDLAALAVWFGAVRATQIDGVAEAGVLTGETATIDVIVRAHLVGDDSRAADEAAEGLADQIVGALSDNPRLAGGFTVAGLDSLAADMPAVSGSPEATVTSTLILRVIVQGEF